MCQSLRAVGGKNILTIKCDYLGLSFGLGLVLVVSKDTIDAERIAADYLVAGRGAKNEILR